MRLLLDSHTIIWWALFPGRLKSATRRALISPDNDLFLSAVTVWELQLKIAQQQISLPADFTSRLLADGFDELPIELEHASRAAQLPPLHTDPFDRLLIAQALAEGLLLVTSDREIFRYDVPVMEA
jgi:PIN domain nuclease of toxin-antitoxin system